MSRFPRPYSGALYDRSLVQAAPQVSRADRQAGYDVDILEQGRANTNIVNPQRASQYSNFERGFKPLPPINLNDPEKYNQVPDSPPPVLNGDPYDYNSSIDDERNGGRSRKARLVAFCKSKRGKMVILLLIIVFVGILCGIGAGVATSRRRASAGDVDAESSNNDGGNGESASESGGVGSGTSGRSSTTLTRTTTTSRPIPTTTRATSTDPLPTDTAGGDEPAVTRTITAGVPEQPTQGLPGPVPRPLPEDPDYNDDDDFSNDTPWYCSISNLIPGCKIPAPQ